MAEQRNVGRPWSSWGYRGLILVSMAVVLACMVLSMRVVGHPFMGARIEPTLTVSSTNEGHWNGPRAGLQASDRLLAMDGATLSTMAELRARLEQAPAGTAHRYLIDRAGERKELLIPSQVLTWKDFVLSFLVLDLVGVAYLVIGCFAFLLKPGHAAAQALLIQGLATALFISLGNDYDSSQAFTRLLMPAIPLFGASYLHLALAFPVAPRRLSSAKMLLIAYLPAVLFALAWELSFQPLGYAAAPGMHDLHFTFLQLSYLWIVVGMLALIGKLVFVAWRDEREAHRQQAKVALFGSFVAYAPAVLLAFIPAMTNSYSISGSGFFLAMSVLNLFFPSAIGVAIVRYRMFDIDVIIKRTLVYSSIALVLSLGYFGLSAALRFVLYDLIHLGGSGSELANILTAGAIAVLFAPVRDRLQALLDRLFQRGKFDFRQVVSEFTGTARETFEPAKLLEAFHHAIDRSLHPRHLSILLREGDGLAMQYSVGLPVLARPPELEAASFEAIARGGLTTVIPVAGPLDERLRPALYAPLSVNEELLGLVALGPRQSDQDYTAEDKQLVEQLRMQLSLALKTSQLVRDLAGQERIKRELEIASDVQNGLLPKTLPEVPGLSLAAHAQPALEIGGDFYDVLQLDEHTWGFIVGDVSGKGMPAALLGAVCLTVFRSVAPGMATATEAMAQINRVLYKYRPNDKMFVSALYARYDTRTRTLQVVNAGQPLPYHGDQAVEIKGMPLGIRAESSYRQVELQLEPGQRFLAITDGLEDARRGDGERYGAERIAAALAREVAQPLAPAIHAVVEEAHRFIEGSPPYDDITMLALEGR